MAASESVFVKLLSPSSLRWRLIAVMSLAYLLVAAATGVASYTAQERNLHAQVVAQTLSDASILAAGASPLLSNPNRAVSEAQLQQFVASLRLHAPGIRYAAVAGENSRLVASTDQSQVARGRRMQISFTLTNLKPRAITLGNGDIQAFALTSNLTPVEVIVRGNVQRTVIASSWVDLIVRFAGLLLFLLLSLAIARYILEPVAVLSRAALAIRRGQLSERVPVNSGTELNTLSDAFNDMAAALELRIQHLQFLANAGAVLPTSFREGAAIDDVLQQFCERLDTCGVVVHAIEDDAVPNLRYHVPDSSMEWEAAAEQFSRYVTHPKAGMHGALPVMAVPVLGDAVFLTARSTARPFTDEEQQVITNFAYQIGIAADNARLFEAQQEALRLKDQFLSIVSHELRTPLTTIRGYAQMLQRKMVHDADGKRFADTIEVQVGRLGRMVDDLLDVTRFTRGEFELSREAVSMRQVLEDVVHRFQIIAPRHRLILQAEPDDLQGEWDADRLEQVVNNLVSNAIKYSPDGGDIVVTMQRRDRLAVVSIRDQGQGIPEEDQERLFERYFRGSAEGGEIKGLGLGLYVTRRIIEAHGGSISVSSKPNKGTEFRFILPLSPQLALT